MRSGLGILSLAAVAAAVLLCAGSADAVRFDSLTISAPADITTSANMPCGQTYCAQVYFTFTASGGTPPYNFVCGAYPGSLFTVGSHTVGCLAQDAAGNSTPTATFTITVTDYVHDVTPPVFQNVPGPFSATADGSGRAVVSWPPLTAIDAHDGSVPVHCQPSSGGGDAFPVGVTTVTCTAEDSSANTATASFTITVSAAGPSGNTTTTTVATVTTSPQPPPPPPPPPIATTPPVTTTVTETVTQPATPPTPPLADFTAALVGRDLVRFTDASSPGSTAIASHTWQFGDGSAASGSTSTHAYRAPGDFYVTEITVDANGLTSVAVHKLTITANKLVLGPRRAQIASTVVAKPKAKAVAKRRAKHRGTGKKKPPKRS